MRLGFLTALAGLLALGVANPTAHRELAKERATVLAMRPFQRSAVELLRVDRRTLEPAGRRRVALGPNPGAWALSPDGKRLAIGVERALGLRILDVTRMRRVADVKTRNGQIIAAAWLSARRIVGVEATGLFVVDPVSRQLIASGDLAGYPIRVGRTRDALVLLLSPEQLGPARLAVVDAEGDARLTVLDRILAGWRVTDEGDRLGEYQDPGLAVDSEGQRAFVVGGGAPVAEVDIRSGSVVYHGLARREPAARVKSPAAGSTRSAIWLGGGLLALTGEDGRAVGPGQVETTPAGLTLVDTGSWTARTLDRNANSAVYVSGTLLATARALSQKLTRGIGLVGFDRDGSRRFHLFGDEPVAVLERLDQRVFVEAGGAIRGVDVRRGSFVRAPRELPSLLVGSMRRW